MVARMGRWVLPVVAVGLIGAAASGLWAEEAKPKGTSVIAGKVVDADGKAAANMVVRAVKPSANPAAEQRRRDREGNRQGDDAKAPKPQAAEGKPADKGGAEGGDKPKGPGGPPADGERPRRERPPMADADVIGQATTDADGKYTISNLPAGEYIVVAGQRGQGWGRQRVTVAEGQTLSVDLQLRVGPPNRPAPPAEGNR